MEKFIIFRGDWKNIARGARPDEITERKQQVFFFAMFTFFSHAKKRAEQIYFFFREKTTNFTLTYPQIKSKHKTRKSLHATTSGVNERERKRQKNENFPFFVERKLRKLIIFHLPLNNSLGWAERERE
jgi:hypothetical protein